MEKSIYYPGFEVERNNWLKMALLYFDEINPIVPMSGDRYLSTNFRRLRDETDLVSVYRPGYNDARRASLDAIDKIENVLRNPQRYKGVFINDPIEWQNPQMQTSRLFRDKFSDAWFDFCAENNLATQSDEGLNAHSEITLLYMTILSQAISDKTSRPAVTDYEYLDRFGIFTHRVEPETNKNHMIAVEQQIKLKLPVDIEHIPFEHLINLRNNSEFSEKRAAFSKSYSKYLSKLESDVTTDYEGSLKSTLKELTSDIVGISASTIQFGVGAWILLDGNTLSGPEIIKEIAGASLLVTGSYTAVRSTWKNTKSDRLSRRYLASLERLW